VSLVLPHSVDVCAVVPGEGLQVNCSLRHHVIPLSHFRVQDDAKDGVVHISITCCLNTFSIQHFYICETILKC
jgi:hypothetical protein